MSDIAAATAIAPKAQSLKALQTAFDKARSRRLKAHDALMKAWAALDLCSAQESAAYQALEVARLGGQSNGGTTVTASKSIVPVKEGTSTGNDEER